MQAGLGGRDQGHPDVMSSGHTVAPESDTASEELLGLLFLFLGPFAAFLAAIVLNW